MPEQPERGNVRPVNLRRLATIVSRPIPQLVVQMVLGFLFLIQIPFALLTGLRDSVPYLVFLSLWALVVGHWSAALSALAACYADPETDNPGS